MNTSKSTIALALGIALFGGSAAAAPFNENRVSKDARWIAHIDMEALSRSELGQFGLAQAKAALDRANESMVSVDTDLVLAEIKSITAYGTDLENDPQNNSVLVVEGGEKLQLIVDGLIANMEASAEGEASEDPPFKRIDDRAFPSYLFGNEVYLAYPAKRLLMVSKDFGRIEQAYAAYSGKAPNLSKAAESVVLNREPGFFFLATASGFSGMKNVPQQARILQKTTGGQISFGEIAGEFRANLVLGTTGAEVSDQLSRILQGMIALASFATVEDQGLADLTQRMTVSQADRSVSIDLLYPTKQILALAQSAMTQDQNGQDWGEDHNGDDARHEPGSAEEPEE